MDMECKSMSVGKPINNKIDCQCLFCGQVALCYPVSCHQKQKDPEPDDQMPYTIPTFTVNVLCKSCIMAMQDFEDACIEINEN